MTAFEFRENFTDPETKIFAAVPGEDFVIPACAMLTQIWVWQTDGRTDRQTDASTMAKKRDGVYMLSRVKKENVYQLQLKVNCYAYNILTVLVLRIRLCNKMQKISKRFMW